MSNATVVYCFPKKADRKDINKYLELAKFINRQASEGAELSIQGLFEAKKGFHCDTLNPIGHNFNVAKGECFLLVDGKTQDANHWRLHRAVRSEEERQLCWPWTGIPCNEAVYETGCRPDDLLKELADLMGESVEDETDETDCCPDDFLKELAGLTGESVEDETDGNDGDGHDGDNDYLKQLDVDLPRYEDEKLPPEQVTDNYVVTYQIKHETDHMREDTWCLDKIDADRFADAPKLQQAFKKMVKCNSAKKLKAIPLYRELVDEIIRMEEMDRGKTEAGMSVVIAVIDGTNNHWRCGVWCYRRKKDQPMEIHACDYFHPQAYLHKDHIWIPYFESED